MGFICLICKDRLKKKNAYCENGLVESYKPLIVTECGHLYHKECLESWLETERIKKQNLNDNIIKNGTCPLCQTEIKEDSNRNVYPTQDDSEALEKAQYIEKLENLEIYCHQLEVQNQQMRRENEIIRESVSCPTSPMGMGMTEDYDGEPQLIMKNDRIFWIKDRDNPQSGTLLQISKKSGKICAKIKLDQKVKPNLISRSTRILSFSSFRSQDKYTITVPFEEIISEKEYQKLTERKFLDSLQVPNGRNLSMLFPQQTFRSSSTTSLPGDIEFGHIGNLPGGRRLSGIQESDDDSVRIAEAKNPVIRSLDRPERPRSEMFTSSTTSLHLQNENMHVFNLKIPSIVKKPPYISQISYDSINSSFEEQRDYVFITPSDGKDRLGVSSSTSLSSIRSKSPEPYSKSKHVTFAEKDNENRSLDSFKVGDHVFWNDSTSTKPAVIIEVNNDNEIVIEILNQNAENHWLPHLTKVQCSELSFYDSQTPTSEPPSPLPRKDKLTLPTNTMICHRVFSIDESENSSSNTTTPTFATISEITESEAFSFAAPLKTPNPFSSPTPFEMTIFEEDSEDGSIHEEKDNSTAFDSTLLALFYGTRIFDNAMLHEKSNDDNLACAVKFILRENFAIPLRTTSRCDKDYAYKLQDLILHLCSSYVDIEEMVTILFELVFKMPPFIRYCFDMTDYLHQFFIDFKDKNKITTVDHLFQTSCRLQDNLTLKRVPAPALILQIPRSDEKFLHYDAVIPNLTLNISNLIEQRADSVKHCFCDNMATVECTICSKINGNACVLFCEACQDVLIQMHVGMDHELNIRPVESRVIRNTSETRPLNLTAVICVRDDRYVTFLRNGPDKTSPWVFISQIINGEPCVKYLPKLGQWLEELGDNPESLKDLDSIPTLLRRLIIDSRIFIYHPEILSESL